MKIIFNFKSKFINSLIKTNYSISDYNDKTAQKIIFYK